VGAVEEGGAAAAMVSLAERQDADAHIHCDHTTVFAGWRGGGRGRRLAGGRALDEVGKGGLHRKAA